MNKIYYCLLCCLSLLGFAGCSSQETGKSGGDRALLVPDVQYDAAGEGGVKPDLSGVSEMPAFSFMTDLRGKKTASFRKLDGGKAGYVVEYDKNASWLSGVVSAREVEAWEGSEIAWTLPSRQVIASESGTSFLSNMLYTAFVSDMGSLDKNGSTLPVFPATSVLNFRIKDSSGDTKARFVESVSLTVSGNAALTGSVKVDMKTGKIASEQSVAKSLEIAAEEGAKGWLIGGEPLLSAAVYPGSFSEAKVTVSASCGDFVFNLKDFPVLHAGYSYTVELDLSKADSAPKLKRIGILGDSISTFEGWIGSNRTYYPRGTITKVEQTWWYKLIFEKFSDACLDVNNSYSGTTVSTNDPSHVSPKVDFVTRASGFRNPDIVFIHGGTNDVKFNTLQGEYDYGVPKESLNQMQFRPAYIKLILTLQELYPQAAIVCIIGDWLGEDYAVSIRNIAGHYNLPCVDFYGDKDKITKVDGSHPDEAGFDYMVEKIFDKVKNL